MSSSAASSCCASACWRLAMAKVSNPIDTTTQNIMNSENACITLAIAVEVELRYALIMTISMKNPAAYQNSPTRTTG
jgi:hypothetical protein